MASNITVSMNGVAKKLGSFELGPFDLQFEQSYIYAIAGENGAGKSSMFGLMMNALKPNEGGIEIFGQTFASKELAIKQRIGHVSNHQFWEDFDLRTVEETVAFISTWYEKWDEQAFWAMTVRLGLERSQKIKQLSTGFKQRLAIALALSYDPDLLLLDEATNGLDFQTTRLVHDELVRFMGKEGKTVILATHILEEIRKLADFIVFLHQGNVLGVFEKDALLGDWKRFWIERLPVEIEQIPGVTAIELNGSNGLVMLVSSDADQTEQHLVQTGIRVANVQAMELQDILTCLIELKMKG